MPFKKGDPNIAPGGKRANAGRKPKEVKALISAVSVMSPEQAIANLEEMKRRAFDEETPAAVAADLLKYLTDRVMGKPKEPKEHSGGLTIRIEGYSPDLAE